MKKKLVIAMALLLYASSFSSQAQAAETIVPANSVFENQTSTAKGTIFDVAIGDSLIINESTKFLNNSTSSHGGAIFSKGDLDITGATFDGNKGTSNYSMGGAVLTGGVVDGTLPEPEWTFTGAANVKDSTFTNNKASNGGAIYNQNRLTVDNTKFIGNEILVHNDAWASGGAIDNNNRTTAVMHVTNSYFEGNKNGTANGGGAIYFGTLSDELSYVKGSEFVRNDSTYRTSSSSLYGTGGAINIENGNFLVENSKFTENKSNLGGAIYNRVANVEIKESTFTGNTATGSGGAIYTESDLTISNSTFTGNSVTGESSSGGAIFVDAIGKEVNINNSTFTGNSTVGSNSDGSAISVMNGTVNINGSTFKENTANWGTVYQYSSRGGDRVSTINIDGSTFENNSANSVGGVGIFNVGNITNTKFIGNKATSATDDGAGALFIGAEGALAVLDNVTFDSNTSAAAGGAIGTRVAVNADSTKNNNSGAVLNVTNSTFKNNTAATTGGAIDNYLYADTSVENSTFENNSAKKGGAIYNHGEADYNGNYADIDIIGSTFKNNTAEIGGAIYTESKMQIENSTFENNTATSDWGGGAIKINITNDVENNKVTISNSTFTGNKAVASGADSGAISIQRGNVDIDSSTFKANESDWTSAIYAYKASGDVNISNSTFEENIASDAGTVSNFSQNGKMTIKNTIFKNNKVTGAGSDNDGAGALFVGSDSATRVEDSTFEGNSSAGVGGAIATRSITEGNNTNGKLDILNTTFTNNTAVGDGGAIYNAFYNSEDEPDNVSVKNSLFDGNSSKADGGAIYNAAADLGGNTSSIAIEDTDFTNNSASGNGGAIYSYGDVNLKANAKDITFEGNSAADGADIYMAASSDLNMNIASGKSIFAKSGISGIADGYNINVTGGGTFDVQTSIANANLIVDASTLWLGQGSNVNGLNNHITLNDGSTLNTINNKVDTFDKNLFTANGKITLKVDVDVETGEGDRIGDALTETPAVFARLRAATAAAQPEFIIDEVNPLGNIDGPTEFNIYEALGLNPEQASLDLGSVATAVENVVTPVQMLTGSVSSDGTVKYVMQGWNPSVMVSSVAAQLGGFMTQLNSYDEAFRNMDMYMLMTKEQRQAMKYANKYAAGDSQLAYSPVSTHYSDNAGWFRPYATFERVGLKNGPKVSNVMWGSYAGLDSEMYDLGKGWDGMFSVYAGYNGSHQSFQGNSIYQNGGSLGLTGIAYKGNFFTGLTANIGASVADADTMYGSEDFTMLMTGIASKTGYNYELKDGKFIIQPSLLMAYTMVNTFDYTNAGGARIDSDPLHAITFEPGVKFIANLKNGWQPYAGVSVVMNAMDDTQFKANDISLPELSVKPYAKYGVGVRKTWGERISGFFQAFVTSGGRNGVGLQGGVRIKLGSEAPKKANSTGERKVIR